MARRTQARFSHIAMSVADLERAVDFYTGVFGFSAGKPYAAAGRRVAALMEADPQGFDGVFLRLDDLLLELLAHARPIPPDQVPRRAAELGIAHLSFVVDDLAEVIARVEAAGGHVRTRLQHEFEPGPATEIVFCTDPDGNRIELIEHPDRAQAGAHRRFLGLSDLGWPAADR
jgi:glyoxylase I family protein